jgi:nucleotide-binding universal stress UspA family protein
MNRDSLIFGISGTMFDLLVGSVSHAVLRETRVPVLLVPARD